MPAALSVLIQARGSEKERGITVHPKQGVGEMQTVQRKGRRFSVQQGPGRITHHQQGAHEQNGRQMDARRARWMQSGEMRQLNATMNSKCGLGRGSRGSMTANRL